MKIGCCGFPTGIEKYAKKFKLVETQSTFYKLPSAEVVKRWRREVPPNFEFTVKGFQGISHTVLSPTWKRSGLKKEELERLSNKVGFLRPTEEVFEFWRRTLEVCRWLGASVCVVQLPASFKENEENRRNLREFFSSAERGVHIALELRGWSERGIKEVCAEFDLLDVCDPFRRLPCHFGSAGIAYLRLHGSPPGKTMYRHKYTDQDLLWLAEQLKGIERAGVKEIYCLFNNMYMFEDAGRFRALLESAA